jgi:endonuclease YncB( thermonuclease family)
MLNIIHSISLAAALLVASFPPTAAAKPHVAKKPTASRDFTGTVVKVSDGDTYIVKRSDGSEVKVRLHWADCPEIAHRTGEVDQPGGREALEWANKLLLGVHVAVHPRGESYGRIVGDINLADAPKPPDAVKSGESPQQKSYQLSLDLVARGLARVDPRYHPTKALIDAESDARKNKRGLWSDPSPVPPWEWRKMTRDQQLKSRSK